VKQSLRIAVLVLAITSVVVWLGWNHVEYLSATKHDTGQWAVIQDIEGSMLAIETTDNTVWNELVQLHQNEPRCGLEVWWSNTTINGDSASILTRSLSHSSRLKGRKRQSTISVRISHTGSTLVLRILGQQS
jgi:hypothetical protein